MATPSNPKPNRGRSLPGVLLALVAAAVVGGLIADAINGSSSSTTTRTVAAASGGPVAATEGGGCNVPAVADKKLPSVVTIIARGPSGGGVGSGEILRSNGYILTNNHVVSPAVSGGSLDVLFNNGKTESATVTGRDPLTDVAVIKVNGESGLPAISIGNSSKLRVGQPVIALGAPLGLANTVTSGIVSGLGRTIQVPGEGSRAALLLDAIQTDAAINPGNSGGALVDCSGNLVGIPSAGASAMGPEGQSSVGNIGLGFAIPVNLATTIANELISTGKVTHAFLGIQAVPTAAIAGGRDVPEGLFVGGVVSGGPAERAGLRMGDVITSIAGQPAVSTDQLMELTLRKRVGDRVQLGYERNGSRSTAMVTLGAQPS